MDDNISYQQTIFNELVIIGHCENILLYIKRMTTFFGKSIEKTKKLKEQIHTAAV